MNFDIVLTPNGHLVVPATDGAPAGGRRDRGGSSLAARLRTAFASGVAEGLLTLANERLDDVTAPVVLFWRDFAARYMSALCQTPGEDGADEGAPGGIPPPENGELERLAIAAPPMQGGEYLSGDLLQRMWRELDEHVRGLIAAEKSGVTGFLSKHAPLWHQVGRICFHLAENRRDADFPFAFLATYAPRLGTTGRVQYQPLSKALREYAGAKNKRALVRLLSPIHKASEQSELIRELIDSGDIFHPLAWTPREAYQFLQQVPIFEANGILVRLPDWWKKRPRPKVQVTIGSGGRKQTIDSHSLFDFNVSLALGDDQLSQDEWQQLLSAEDGLVMLRGQWVEVDQTRLREALEHWQRVQAELGDGVSMVEAMRLLAGAPRDLGTATETTEEDRQWSQVTAGKQLGQLLQQLRAPETLKAATPGKDFQARLRPYQQVGVNWLWLLSQLGLGACLADDMGLGKTIQVLALLTILRKGKRKQPSLLVVPTSLLANWKAEIARFAPNLKCALLHASETPRQRLEEIAQRSAESLHGVDLAITTYGMVPRQPWLENVSWRLVIIDEAQAIKTPSTRQTRAIKRLPAHARLALTGTPIENHFTDLWSIFDFLCPGLLGSLNRFKSFVKHLESDSRDGYAPLRRLVQPYILRRLKTDPRIISDLPEKTEVRAYCGLTRRQAAIYAKLVEEMSRTLRDSEGMKRRGLVLSYLMRFKQLCNHPSQLTGDGDFAPQQSGKFARLAELCEEIAERQERLLVFTQFREMTQPLAEYLARTFGRPGSVLHGGTPVRQRRQLIERFQADDGPPFLVLSLKAGGTGLNLTAASQVIHFDRWWNPAVENQATDRAFRIGQSRRVLVHKFVCRGTIEERIDAMIEEKTHMANEVLDGGGEKILTEMSNDELLEWVSLDLEKAMG